MISKTIAHPALVSEQDFVAAQAIRAARPTEDGSARTYLLAGLLQCRPCGRRMDSHWVHQRPGYRCRHGHTSSQQPAPDRHKTLYVREDHILATLPARIADLGIGAQQTASAPSTLPSNDPRRVVDWLQTNNVLIICDTTGWVLKIHSPGEHHQSQHDRLTVLDPVG